VCFVVAKNFYSNRNDAFTFQLREIEDSSTELNLFSYRMQIGSIFNCLEISPGIAGRNIALQILVTLGVECDIPIPA
jgi:hypothetical protein